MSQANSSSSSSSLGARNARGLALAVALISGACVVGVALVKGFKHGALAAGAAVALGDPTGLATLERTPRFVAFIPHGLGATLAVAATSVGALAVAASFEVGESLVSSMVYGCGYAVGALAGGSLVSRPQILAPVGVCVALWQCW